MSADTIRNKWETVNFEQLSASIPDIDFEGLAGFEECFDYEVVSSRKSRKKKCKKKHKSKGTKLKANLTHEKVKICLENGFTVETLISRASPSSNDSGFIQYTKKAKKTINPRDQNNENNEFNTKIQTLSLDQVTGWLQFALPESIIKALVELGFKHPTNIQELVLPAALHGRRDILGAAETGSGKTLAFGLPIITGILELKEKKLDNENKIQASVSNKQVEDESTKIINMNKLTKNEVQKLLLDQKNNESFDVDESDDTNSNFENSDISSDFTDSDESVSNSDDIVNDKLNRNNCISHIKNKTNNIDLKENICNAEDEKLADEDMIVNNEEYKPVLTSNVKPLYALILTPTRELAIQVKNHIVDAAKYTGINVAVVIGGMAQVKQERLLAKGPEIVVATPGRLWEMIEQRNDHLMQIPNIKYLAIDETDRMIERGHFEELHHILDKINSDEYNRMKRQNFVFSATLTMVHDLPQYLKTKKNTRKRKNMKVKIEKFTPEQKLKKIIDLLGISNPKIVDITKQNQGSSNTLTECRIMCSISEKDYYLYYVLSKHPGRTIIFCNSIGCVKRLSQLFGILNCNPLPLHANMQQRQRLKNLDRFRDNPQGILIATDVAARGLDIPNVEHVIHYQVPRTAENYVHRSGRTARANKEGITILIIEPGEVPNYIKMCVTLSKADDLPDFPISDALLPTIKERVNLAREIDQLELKMRKMNSEMGWYERAIQEMDIVVDENEMPQRMEKYSVSKSKTFLSYKKKQLNGLLSTPVFPKGFSFKYPCSNDALTETLTFGKKQNALQVMKAAIESGVMKKRKSLKSNLSKHSNTKKYNQNSNISKTNGVNKWKKDTRQKKISKK